MAKQVTILQNSVSLGDPHLWTDNRDRLSVRFAVYETLVKFAEDGTFLPCLAESWQCSQDACRWSFNLRQEVVFHDGTPLTSADVAACLERVMAPGMAGELGTDGLYAVYLGGSRIEITSDASFTLHLPAPMADLLDILVYLPITPGVDFSSLSVHPNGTGAYRFLSQHDGEVRLARNESYWGDVPAYDEVLWQAASSVDEKTDALLAGKADLCCDIPYSVAGTLGIPTVSRNSHWATIIMLNCMQGPCTNKVVRQALNYGVNVPLMIKTLMKGGAVPLHGPLTDSHLGYNPQSQPYGYDPQKARTLLHEAGYGSGLSLTMDIPMSHPDESPALARMAVDQLHQVGVELLIRPHADRVVYAQLVKSKQIGDACIFDSSPLSTYRTLREKFHSGVAGSWWQGYHNEEVDCLMEQAWQTQNQMERKRLYEQAVQKIRDDSVWIFLYTPIFCWGVGGEMKNWKPGINGLVQL
jgi:peptide/nickel transport system substrate-binding protein